MELGKRLRVVLDVAASLAVIVVAGVLLLRTDGGGDPPPIRRDLKVPTSPVAIDGASIVGDRSARAAIMEFADFQCPFCAKFNAEVLPELKSRYLSTGRLMLAFRNLPIESHRNARPAAGAGVCAAEQGRFGAMYELLLAN